MATTNFESEFFLGKVMPHVPGCILDLAVDKIRDAAIDFCERTHAWVYDHPDIDMVADESEYSLVPPADTKIDLLHWVWYRPSGRVLWPKGADRLARMYRNWREYEATEPTYITSLDLDANTFRLVPIPTTSETGGLGPLVSLKPLRDADGIDTKLAEEYVETIAEGALARLLRLPERFGDPLRAADAQERFRVQCNRAFNRVLRSLGRDHEVQFTRA